MTRRNIYFQEASNQYHRTQRYLSMFDKSHSKFIKKLSTSGKIIYNVIVLFVIFGEEGRGLLACRTLPSPTNK